MKLQQFKLFFFIKGTVNEISSVPFLEKKKKMAIHNFLN